MPLHTGIGKVFPLSEVGFVAILEMSKRSSQTNLENRYVILSDTMLATGGSILNAIRIIKNNNPKKIFVVTAMASRYGVDRVSQERPDVSIFTAAIDPYVNSQGYIIPGLGDVGDRSYGEKYITVEVLPLVP